MTTAAERIERISAIRNLPHIVESAIQGLNDEQLDTPYRDGGWTVRQVVHHIADSHINAFIRMKLTLTEDHPTVKPYDQDAWAKLADTSRLPLDSSLSILQGLHQRWGVLLESIPDLDWGRTAFHPENGEMTLDDFLKLYAWHGAHHVEQITGLRKGRGW